MTEKRCPMCGNINEPDVEICKFCQARIKPLFIDPSLSKEDNTKSDSFIKDSVDGQSEVANWLQELKGHQLENPPGEAGDRSPEQEEKPKNIDDWISEYVEDFKDATEQVIAEDEIASVGFTKPQAGEEIGVPVWLTSLRSGINTNVEKTLEDQENVENQENIDEGESIPDWLQYDRDESTVIEANSVENLDLKNEEFLMPKIPPEGLVEIQSLLSTQAPSETTGDDQQDHLDFEKLKINQEEKADLQPQIDYPGIEKAQIPDWLQSLREKVIEASEPESNGTTYTTHDVGKPLLGIAGALLAEQKIHQPQKSLQYSSKLHVTEQELSLATSIEDMFKKDELSPPKLSRSTSNSQRWIRLGVFFILAIGSIIPYLFQINVAPNPILKPEVYDLFNIINHISNEEPIAVVFDYTPGYSGEIDLAARSVLDHLMDRRAFLVLVSSLPTGSLQGERLIKFANKAGTYSYQPKLDYVNLGFIPGGVTGITKFVNAPRNILPYSLDGGEVWKSHAIESVYKLSDFALVLVITDSPDTARTWIEQSQNHLKQIPLIFVVSAQAEPILKPYYNANPRQVAGYLSGLEGGVTYQDLIPHSVQLSNEWQGYQFILFVTTFLILAGAIVSAFNYYRSLDRKTSKTVQR